MTRSRAGSHEHRVPFSVGSVFAASIFLAAYTFILSNVFNVHQQHRELEYLDIVHNAASLHVPSDGASNKVATHSVDERRLSVNEPPVDCWDFLDRVRAGKLKNVKDPNDMNYIRLMTPEKDVHFWASFHSQTFDAPRWTSYLKGFYYERQQVKQWVRILNNSPANSRVLDVGGNIGIYSLLSAASGPFTVDAFEPNIVNVLRFCESLTLNGWKNEYQKKEDSTVPSVNLYQYGISDKAGQLEFFPSTNPGAGSFQVTRELSGEPPSRLNVSSLDDFARERNWFETRPHISILKVDVERYEAQVFRGAKELLHAHLVQNIFVEASIEDPKNVENDVAALQLLVDAGYKLNMTGNWAGPKNPWPHSDRLMERLVEMLKKNKYVNLLWTL